MAFQELKQTELVDVEVHPQGLLSVAHEDNYPLPAADDRTHDGSVDLKGRPASKSHSGGFKAASFIIGVELGERMAFYGIQSNLSKYLKDAFRESNPEATRNVNNWTGATLVMPIVGGFFADAYWGKYWTIAIVVGIYVLVPDSMRSLGMALYVSANGVGSLLSNLLLAVVGLISGKEPWLQQENMNRSRVDLFYWLLAVLSMLNLLAFNVVAYFYEYKKVKSPLIGTLDNVLAPNHTGLSHKDSLQRYHHRPSNASSTSSQ